MAEKKASKNDGSVIVEETPEGIGITCRGRCVGISHSIKSDGSVFIFTRIAEDPKSCTAIEPFGGSDHLRGGNTTQGGNNRWPPC